MADDPKRTNKHTRLAITNACEICAKKKVPFVMIFEESSKGSRVLTNCGEARLENFKHILQQHIDKLHGEKILPRIVDKTDDKEG